MRSCYLSLLILLGIGSAGCCWNRPKQRIDTVEPHRIPLEWSKEVEPLGQQRATHPLRDDVLYVADPSPPGLRTRWFRFWPNGRAIEKLSESFEPQQVAEAPTAFGAESFERGITCFYSIVGDQFTVEFIAPNDDEALIGPCNKFARYRGRVNDDGSFTLAEVRPRGLFKLTPEAPSITFRPHAVGAKLTRQPDW